jgi:hypothetical protein
MLMGVFRRLCRDYNCYLVAVRAGDHEAAQRRARYMYLCWPLPVLEGLPLPPRESVGFQPPQEGIQG